MNAPPRSAASDQGQAAAGKPRWPALVLLGLLLAGTAVVWRSGRGTRASGPLRQEGYLWQRHWQAADVAAAAHEGLAGVVVLAAEADLARQPPRIVETGAALEDGEDGPFAVHGGDTGCPGCGGPRRQRGRLGLALRLGPLAGRAISSPDIARRVIDLAWRAVARARAGGWTPAELQIDFDCAEAGLEDYARLAQEARRVLAPLPVTVTALPAWLDQRRGFALLAAAVDGFILQVHSLARPAAPASPLVLCDVVAARQAVAAAARFGRPFRVALPTYGYAVGFDAAGRFLGLAAETPSLRWPPGTTLRTVRSDPDAMSGLVRTWTRDRPRELRGLLWYRLPGRGDRLNWRWPTLRAVMAGRRPRHRLRVAPKAALPGGRDLAGDALAEIELANSGEADEPWPAAVRVGWQGPKLVAADGLAGYRAVSLDRDGLRLEWMGDDDAQAPVLAPGERRLIGWLRFTTAAEVQVELEERIGLATRAER